ncbi:MAG: antibiotic biosynthesis monooxygenase [Acidobacteria bacterium]|nr:antibiotic biosynthesis monooxygenase [Acidobacteriota bacterium]
MQRRTLVVALILSALAGGGARAAGQAPQAAPPQPAPGPRYIATYVDVAPASEAQALALALLKGYRDASRREDGNARADILQQTGRPGQFIIVEEWRDDAAWKAHRAAARVAQFHEKLTPLRITAYDERVHTAFAVGAASTVPATAVFVVTHVDVIPAGLPKARELLNAQVEHTRKENGNLRFDVLQGARMNHFTVVEAWRDDRAREAHITAPHTRTYREGLRETAIDGSPYDERLYRLVQ